jgi:hypothetical protein
MPNGLELPFVSRSAVALKRPFAFALRFDCESKLKVSEGRTTVTQRPERQRIKCLNGSRKRVESESADLKMKREREREEMLNKKCGCSLNKKEEFSMSLKLKHCSSLFELIPTGSQTSFCSSFTFKLFMKRFLLHHRTESTL